jgi:hypothetical protein
LPPLRRWAQARLSARRNWEPGSYELRFTAGADPKLHALQLTITK